ncbi:hypothetical protein LTR62_008276 [Meristemomyces frigidus]|uniref:ER membrane protein complex subunit 1 n=1 Tax=Meristemomyces frigidus TaxID=1508187 RepID=A0AAN7TB08_9PEZI|nr:hypothetical protein LTR62_008276 [Meristemomyces frigidus]
MLLPLLSAATLLLTPSLAVFQDEAFHIDYHFALLGAPKESTTFFHQPNPASKASLIYTLSEEGALGAVNPRDGSLVWRQLLQGQHQSNASFLRAGEGQDLVVSGSLNQVAAWSAEDGRLAWRTATDGVLRDVEILELSDGKEMVGAKDAVALSGSHGAQSSVVRLDGATGAVKWTYEFDGSDEAYQVSASSTHIYAILLHKTLLGYLRIRVVSLDPVTGKKIDEYMLSSENELATADTIVSVGANSASPIIAWTDAAHSTLKVNVVGSKAISSFTIDQHAGETVARVQVHAPYHINSLSHFLVHYETATSHWADVFHVDVNNGKVTKAYSLPKLAGKGAFSTSTSDANVYFTRITRDELSTVSSASHGILGRWPVTSFGVVSGIGEVIEPVHAVSEVSVKGDAVSAIRTVVLLSTGDWILLRGGTATWNRPEILASTVAATFAMPAEVEAFAERLQAEASSNPVSAYVQRLTRHIAELKDLPALLVSFPQRVVNGFLGTSEDDLASDNFGFHQIITCATRNGRMLALDAGNPNRILWNRQVADLKKEQAWNPRLASSKGGEVTINSQAGTGFRYNISNGEQLVSILPVDVEGDAKAAREVRFTMTDSALDATVDSKPAWHFSPASGQTIHSLVPRPVNDPVASIGKVLGDRRVLYKYLDPNLALLVTKSSLTLGPSNTATFYVLNTVSGAILHASTHNDIDLTSPIATLISENWLAYSFTSAASATAPKGQQLVIGELFESLVPNDRGPLTGNQNYSSTISTPEPYTLTHTYQIPEAISKLAVTRTKQGITSRQLLALLPDSGAIVGIPYNALNPRRPVGRDATKDEQAEGLLRYNPVLEFDPKWLLSHQREVLGLEEVVTSPALIESTSLVFAWGLDVFGTKISPSFSFDILGRDFNKFQMLGTVAALGVLTFVVAPLVTRKQVDQRWKFL